MFEIVDNIPQGAVIKVMGVGGAGGNAIKHMIDHGVCGPNFCGINTDAQDLCKLGGEVTPLQIGSGTTRGLGAGADPNVGRQAAEEDREAITRLVQGADMLFIAAGMGGGTGTGAAPVVAEIAKSLNILTVAVVTKPFAHENRIQVAEGGLTLLNEYADTVIVVSNDKLLEVLGSKISLVNAFAAANDILLGAVQGIADLIIRPGLVNVDFADVQTIMLNRGNAMMGTGIAKGENRAEQATSNAIRSPLLEDIALNSAQGLLVNVTADPNLGMGEYNQICNQIRENYAADGAQMVVGAVLDDSMGDAIKVTVVATGVYPRSAKKGSNDKDIWLSPQSLPQAKPSLPIRSIPPVREQSRLKEDTMPENQAEVEHDYEQLRTPSFIRQQAN